MRALSTPGGGAPAKPESAPAPNYRAGEQRDLNRLIGTQR